MFVTPKPLKLTGNLSENFAKFKQEFTIFMAAAGYSTLMGERKVAILLNIIGEEALDLYNTFQLESEEGKDIEKVLKKFENYCNPKKNILHSRFMFYNRKQQENETFDAFLLDLKNLLRDAEFKEPDEMLRDKVVLDNNDRDTQEKLIEKRQRNTSRSNREFTSRRDHKEKVKDIHGNGKVEVNKIVKKENKKPPGENRNESQKNKKVSEQNKRKCSKRNQNHAYKKYPAFGKQRIRCKKWNHFANACKANINEICNENDSNESKTEYFCNSLDGKNCWKQNLNIENVNIIFKIDTGSDV